MKLKRLCQEVYLQATVPKINFPERYVEIAASIQKAISAFNGVKTDLNCDFGDEDFNRLKATLVLSDFTSVFPMAGGSIVVVMAAEKSPLFPENVTVPNSFAEKLSTDSGYPIITPGYLYRNDQAMVDFLRQVEPLAESGRLMVRPAPIVLGLADAPNDNGGRNWNVKYIDPNSPAEHWLTDDLTEGQNAIPLEGGEIDPELETKVCSITMPYLEGVSFTELSKILDSEGDCLAEFRSSVRKVIVDVRADSAKATDIVNDIVRPATDKIERRFKSISNIHRLKLAGAYVSTAGLSLLALTSSGISASLGDC